MQLQSLGREGPLENEMATHSSILAWRIPWTEEPGRLQSMGSQESDTPEAIQHTHTFRNTTPSPFQTMLGKLHTHVLNLPSLSTES